MTDEWRKRTGGKVVSDSTKTLPVGVTLHLKTDFFPPVIPSGSGDIREWEHFNGVLLAITFTKDTTFFVDGSAVLVAPGIALAARHVVEPWLPELTAGAMVATCHGISRAGLNMWHVRQVTYTPDSDLVILMLALASELPADRVFHKCALTTRTPSVGESMMVAGFKAMRRHFEGAQKSVNFEAQVRVGVGEVTAVYPAGRDCCVLPWPVIEVACSTEGGMSGGPAFDRDGMLIGLLSSSFGHEDGLGPSYVSLLWPALTQNISPEWPNGVYSGPQSLLSIDRRLCFIEKPEAVHVEVDPQTGRLRTTVTMWED